VNKDINPRNYKFCPVCGNHLKPKFIQEEQTDRLSCDNCNFIFYINPIPAVAVILMNAGQIVLVKRKYHPHKGAWTLPAGFMEYDETTEETAIREAKEETNLVIKIKELFGVYPGFDDPRVHVILIVYWGEIVAGEIIPGDDAEEVRFFSLDDLPKNIAFSAHRKILARLIKSRSGNSAMS
jgi:ADP-ribose pyrophosphatase YjhB (NUDIX family)